MKKWILVFMMIVFLTQVSSINASYANTSEEGVVYEFPPDLSKYEDADIEGFFNKIVYRIKAEPFNLVATIIFFLAIVHTMLTSKIHNVAHYFEHRHQKAMLEGKKDKNSTSILGGVFHLLGEVEVVFGLWAIPLAIAITTNYSWQTFVHYSDHLSFIEPFFVIVIMTIASSRPILKLFEIILWRVVRLFGSSIEAWWFSILIIATCLGSFITGPAAMTIAAFILADKFYSLGPSNRLKYGTLALLFINVSVGSSLTNFASPPILMVAGPWNWNIMFMMTHVGWKALLAVVSCTAVYYFIFRNDLRAMKPAYDHYRFKRYIQKRFISKKELEENFEELEKLVDKKVAYTSELDAYSLILKENIKVLASEKLTEGERVQYDIDNAIDEKFEGIKIEEMKRTIPGLLPDDVRPSYNDPNWDIREDRVPFWIMMVHVGFLVWTVVNAHEAVMFITGFLFYLGFYQVTGFYQNRLDLKPALLVAFFLGGLMVHGSLQGWWIAPLLGSLPELGLNITSIILTAFNDNAAITYLSTLVPNLPDTLKYAIVTGAITGGGLTVIANSPNPVGQSILKKYFDTGISAGSLLKYALLPTVMTAFIFFILR